MFTNLAYTNLRSPPPPPRVPQADLMLIAQLHHSSALGGPFEMLETLQLITRLGIPMLPCTLEISICQTMTMTGSSRKNLRKFDIQSQNEAGQKDDDPYYSTDGSL